MSSRGVIEGGPCTRDGAPWPPIRVYSARSGCISSVRCWIVSTVGAIPGRGPSVVAVDGTEPAHPAVRLLRAVLLTAGLAAAGWLLTALFAAGSASADVTLPSDEPMMTGGLPDDLSQVLTGSAQTTAVPHTPPAAADPVSTPPPPATAVATAPPAPVVTRPHKPA